MSIVVGGSVSLRPGSFTVGIVGAGSVADGYHAPVLREMGVNLQWVCDVDRRRAERFAAEHGVALAVTRLDDLPEVDAVLVAIPVGLRRPVLEEAFKRRWSVLVEKPFAVDADEHQRILDEGRHAGVQVGVGLMRRFYRPVLDARSLLRNGVFGSLREVWAAEGFPLRGTGRSDDWYQGDPAAAGGGVVAETGSHLIDQVLFMTDAEEVGEAKTQILTESGLDLEARLEMTAHRRGQQAPLRMHFALSRLRDLCNGIVLCCDHARLKVGASFAGGIELLDERFVRQRSLELSTPGAEAVYQAFAQEWLTFIAQCRGGETTDADAATALLTTKVISLACPRGAGAAAR